MDSPVLRFGFGFGFNEFAIKGELTDQRIDVAQTQWQSGVAIQVRTHEVIVARARN